MSISRIVKMQIYSLNAELIQPFTVATGSHTALENIVVALEFADGTKGLGEAAIAHHITGETFHQTRQNLKSVGERLLGQDAAGYLNISAQLHEMLPHNKCALAAIESAMMDALTRQWGMPLWKFFGAVPQKLVSDITVVIAEPSETEIAVKSFYRQGFRRFKVKIGKDMDADLKRVLTVHRLTKESKMILDANQGYTAEQMLKFLRLLKGKKITPVMLEQPVAREDWEGLKKITRSCKIPVCADESVRSLAEAVKAVQEKAVTAINVKFTKSGLFESREIALLAKTFGLKLMISGMMESALAMTAGAHLAAGMGCFDEIDLDTPFFIKGGVAHHPCLNSRGVYDVAKIKAGIGIKFSVNCQLLDEMKIR